MSDITFIDGSQAAHRYTGVVTHIFRRFPLLRALAFDGLLHLDRFVFGSLIALMVLLAIPYGTVEPWWIALYEAIVFLLMAVWITQGLLSGSWNVSEKYLLAPVGALVLLAFLQTVSWPWATVSADPFETRLTALKFLAFACTGALLQRYTSNSSRLKALIYVVIGVAMASAVFGIVRQAMQQSEVGFILPYLKSNSGFGQFVNKNHFALFIEMAIGLMMGLMFGGGVRRKHWLVHISALALMWIALVLTASRGGFLSMFSQIAFLLAVLIWWRVKAHREDRQLAVGMVSNREGWKVALRLLAVGICLMAVIAVSAVWIGGDVFVSRMESLPGEIRTEAQEPHAGVRRREVWAATWNLVKAHRLTGSGFGAYGIAITRFHDASGKWTPEAAHNDYLELLAAGGLIGTSLVVWFAWIFIKLARRQLSSCDAFRRAACLGALTGIFGVFVHSAVDFGLHVTVNTVAFVALVVIATKPLQRQNNLNPPATLQEFSQ